MAVDPDEPDGTVLHDRVEVGAGREALVGPILLVPAIADDPARRSIGRREGRQPLLQLGDRVRAGQVELKGAESIFADMSMRVDQPGQQRAALAVDAEVDPFGPRIAKAKQLNDLAIAADDQPGEMLQLARAVDLKPVDVVDQRVGKRAGREKR